MILAVRGASSRWRGILEEPVGENCDEHEEIEEVFEKLGEDAYRDVQLESDRVSIKGESFTAQNSEIALSEFCAYRVFSVMVRQCGVRCCV